MSAFSPKALAAELKATLPSGFSGRICIAFSGGLDSAVLLHAISELRGANSGWHVRALHVDHQLQAASGEWAKHCESVAEALQIGLTVAKVVVARDHAQGLEAAARSARYAAIRKQLLEREVVLTAHHADDQAETMLLALMRGSGVQGLAAMPAVKEFGRGWHLRPLLAFTRAELSEWAAEHGIIAVSDPSNALLRHDRNYLRHEVLPLLVKRWPAAATNIARSANHLGEALSLLEELALRDLEVSAVGHCLIIEALRSLSAERCRNLLRYWLRREGLLAPSTRKLAGLMRDLFNTDLDRIPCVTWEGTELHWHRGLLYASSPRAALSDAHSYEGEWSWKESFPLPAKLGRLSMQATLEQGFSAANLPERLTIRFRRGGEKIQLPGRQHRSALRNLFQENDVLPWWRDRIPLVVSGRRLLAVGDLFLSDEFAAHPGEAAVRVVWEGAPRWQAELLDTESA